MKTMLEGKISTFGGPEDKGVTPKEDLALVYQENFHAVFEKVGKYFLTEQPVGTTGTARRLNPKTHYIACRWDYATTPKSYLLNTLVTVTNPKNGKTAQAKPVDWGPAAWTGRIADLSPGLAKFLELKTDDVCTVEITHPGSEVSASRQPISTQHRTVLSEAEIKAEFGAFNYKESTPKGAIIISPPWIENNMTTILIPQLKGLRSYGSRPFSGNVSCHKKVAQPLQDTFAAIEQQGLKDLLLFWGGCHVPRHKSWNPQRGLSSHSWGIAIDLNVEWNAYDAEPAPKGKRGSVIELVPIFESFGFAWGGYFSTKDGMHFEYALKS